MTFNPKTSWLVWALLLAQPDTTLSPQPFWYYCIKSRFFSHIYAWNQWRIRHAYRSPSQNVLSMTEELKLFGEYKERLKAIAGEERARSIVSNSLYVVCSGTDDIANTYFTTPFRVIQYDIPSYVDLLIRGASSFLKVNSIQTLAL